MRRFLVVVVVVLTVSWPALAGKQWHMYFSFSVTGGKTFETESADTETDLGGRDGCRLSGREPVDATHDVDRTRVLRWLARCSSSRS